MKKKTVGQKRLERIVYTLLAIAIVFRFTQAYMDMKFRHSVEMGQRPVPNFDWRDFDSEKRSFASIKNKVVVLHFWASWCGPCRVEFPAMLRAAKQLGDDVVFLTIAGDETAEPAREFLIKAKNAAGVKPDNMLYGWDPMRTLIFDTFQTTAFPETIIVDEDMMMRRKFMGRVDWEDPEILRYLRSLKKPADTKKDIEDTSTQAPEKQDTAKEKVAEVEKPE